MTIEFIPASSDLVYSKVTLKIVYLYHVQDFTPQVRKLDVDTKESITFSEPGLYFTQLKFLPAPTRLVSHFIPQGIFPLNFCPSHEYSVKKFLYDEVKLNNICAEKYLQISTVFKYLPNLAISMYFIFFP